MGKTALLLLLMTAVAFSAITLEEAGDKAISYLESGETVDITPQGLTYLGSDSYWAMELVGTMGKINVMIPIGSETGNIEVGDSMKEVLQTHYLANYFSTDSTIADFLDGVLSYSQSKKTSFSNAIQQLEIYEAQVPAGVTLENLAPLKSALAQANDENDDLRNQVQNAQGIISLTTWRTTHIDSSRSALTAVFTDEGYFLDSLDGVSVSASAFLTELAGNSYMLSNYPSLVQAFQGIITSYELSGGAPVQMGDSLTSNRNAINSFYNSLGITGDEYLAKLRNRVNSYISAEDITAIANMLAVYNANYTYITDNSEHLHPDYSGDIGDLYDAITEAQAHYNNENYTMAKSMFEDIDIIIGLLMGHMGECPPECTNGKIAKSDCTCACPGGTKEEGGKCVSTGFSLNLPLIGGLALIIIALIVFKYKDKLFKGGGQVEEKPKDMWSNYKF